MRNQLIMTVGLPYSGKSNWAIHSGGPVVAPDKIRMALHGQRYEPLAEPMVWAIAKIMVRSLFLAGHNMVVLDATNNTARRRDDWKDELWQRFYVVMDINKEACILRAKEVNDSYIVSVIERMASYIEFEGILHGNLCRNDKGADMADHIRNPNGVDELQLYHEGRAADDI